MHRDAAAAVVVADAAASLVECVIAMGGSTEQYFLDCLQKKPAVDYAAVWVDLIPHCRDIPLRNSGKTNDDIERRIPNRHLLPRGCFLVILLLAC